MEKFETKKPDLGAWTALRRGLLGRCPRCGKGTLFKSYLRQVDCCQVCGERFDHIRADDGPAWLTIVIVGHILAPLLLILVPNSTWSDMAQMLFWPLFALTLALVILPRAKGLFIAILWRMQARRDQSKITSTTEVPGVPAAFTDPRA